MLRSRTASARKQCRAIEVHYNVNAILATQHLLNSYGWFLRDNRSRSSLIQLQIGVRILQYMKMYKI